MFGVTGQRLSADACDVCGTPVDLECSGDDRWAWVGAVGRVADQQDARSLDEQDVSDGPTRPAGCNPSEVGRCLIVKRVTGLFSATSSLNSAFSSLAAAVGEASAITHDVPPVSGGPVVFSCSTPRKPSLRRRLASAAGLGPPAVHEAALRVSVGVPLGEYPVSSPARTRYRASEACETRCPAAANATPKPGSITASATTEPLTTTLRTEPISPSHPATPSGPSWRLVAVLPAATPARDLRFALAARFDRRSSPDPRSRS